MLPMVLQAGSNLLMNLISGIVNNLSQVAVAISTVVEQIVSTIAANLPQILQSGANLLLNLINGIINNLPQVASAAATVIARIVSSIGQNLPQILQSGIEIIGKLAAGLIQAIPNLVGQIPAIISAIVNTFLSTDWGSVGTNIIQGIANGLASAGGALWDAVKGVLGNFEDQVLSFFGIHSPSRWGVYVGEMIDFGFANGITDNMSPITRAVSKLEAEATKPFSSDFAYSISGGSTGMSGNNDNEKILSRLDVLIDLLERNVENGRDTKIVFNDREVARALKEVGVAFG